MVSLDEKADDTRDVVRASEAEAQWYRLESTDLTPAGDIGTDDFPQYGDFADVVAVDANGDDLGSRWLECPSGLARELVDAGIAADEDFQITEASKTADGAWSFSIQTR